MNKEKISVEKYVYTKNGTEYLIYMFPEEDHFTQFYIQKKDYGLISHTVGVHIEDVDSSIEEFINNNIDNWIDICEDNIQTLENVDI